MTKRCIRQSQLLCYKHNAFQHAQRYNVVDGLFLIRLFIFYSSEGAIVVLNMVSNVYKRKHFWLLSFLLTKSHNMSVGRLLFCRLRVFIVTLDVVFGKHTCTSRMFGILNSFIPHLKSTQLLNIEDRTCLFKIANIWIQYSMQNSEINLCNQSYSVLLQ